MNVGDYYSSYYLVFKPTRQPYTPDYLVFTPSHEPYTPDYLVLEPAQLIKVAICAYSITLYAIFFVLLIICALPGTCKACLFCIQYHLLVQNRT